MINLDHEIKQMIEVIRNNPNDMDARRILADLYEDAGRYKEAEIARAYVTPIQQLRRSLQLFTDSLPPN